MQNKLLPFLAGVALSALVVFAIKFAQSSSDDAPLKPGIKATEAMASQTLAVSRKQVGELEAENARLAAELAQLKTGAVVPTEAPAPKPEPGGKNLLSAMFGGGDTNKAAGFAKLMKLAMKQQSEMKVAAMKSRLHLTDEQEESVRALLEKQMGMGAELATKAMEGKLSADDAPKFDLEAELKNVLTPEQSAEYAKYQTEERQNQAGMVANMELGQLQQMLQLPEDQKDKVYAVLYSQAEKQVGQFQDPGKTANALKTWEQQFDAKKEALRGVLTPEQFKSYDKFLETQREMIKSFIPAGNGGASVTIQAAP